MNARQRDEYDDAIAAMRLGNVLANVHLPPRSEAVTAPQSALELAGRLLPQISEFSVIDRRTHALGTARLILDNHGTDNHRLSR